MPMDSDKVNKQKTVAFSCDRVSSLPHKMLLDNDSWAVATEKIWADLNNATKGQVGSADLYFHGGVTKPSTFLVM